MIKQTSDFIIENGEEEYVKRHVLKSQLGSNISECSVTEHFVVRMDGILLTKNCFT